MTIRGRTIDPWDFGTSQDYPILDYCSNPSKRYCLLREYYALPKVLIIRSEQDGRIMEGEAAVFRVTLEETLTSDLDVYVWVSDEGQFTGAADQLGRRMVAIQAGSLSNKHN